MSEAPQAHRSVSRFITRWKIHFGVATVALYAIAVGLVIAVFPEVSNTWLAVIILFAGFTASINALADNLEE